MGAAAIFAELVRRRPGGVPELESVIGSLLVDATERRSFGGIERPSPDMGACIFVEVLRGAEVGRKVLVGAGRSVTFGRAHAAEIRLVGPRTSREPATLREEAGRLVFDVHANTSINGVAVEEGSLEEVRPGDVIEIGGPEGEDVLSIGLQPGFREGDDFSSDLVRVSVHFSLSPLTLGRGWMESYRVVARMPVAQMVEALEPARGVAAVDGVIAFEPFFLRAVRDGCELEYNPSRSMAKERRERTLTKMLVGLRTARDAAQVLTLGVEGWTEAKHVAPGVAAWILPSTDSREFAAWELRPVKIGSAWEVRPRGSSAPLRVGRWEVLFFLESAPEEEIPCDGRPDLGRVNRVVIRPVEGSAP